MTSFSVIKESLERIPRKTYRNMLIRVHGVLMESLLRLIMSLADKFVVGKTSNVWTRLDIFCRKKERRERQITRLAQGLPEVSVFPTETEILSQTKRP